MSFQLRALYWLLFPALLAACRSEEAALQHTSPDATLGTHPRLAIRHAAHKLALANDVTCQFVGRARIEPDHWPHYVTLHDKATTPELVFLTDHPSVAVRCYAYRALADRPDVDLFPIALKHVTDDDSVHTFCGCIGDLTHISWEFRFRGKRAKRPLTPIQVQYLDSVRYERRGRWPR